jgi:CheY-like chemotaxis protein
MPKGGKLAMETSNILLGSDPGCLHPEMSPGCYVLLSISDTGTGIEESNLSRIFEPFYSTKEKDKGTGLGLSMVYGIIRQNEGWIWPSSKLGEGTTFRIYLPPVQAESEAMESAPENIELVHGAETILLVEDQENVRTLAKTVLGNCGYRVLEAAHGQEALQIAADFPGTIDLLLTDVVLPGMTGKDLADRLLLSRPKTKVLFTSGYTENIIAYHGVLQEGIAYLAKPYTPKTLTVKVGKILSEKENP